MHFDTMKLSSFALAHLIVFETNKPSVPDPARFSSYPLRFSSGKVSRYNIDGQISARQSGHISSKQLRVLRMIIAFNVISGELPVGRNRNSRGFSEQQSVFLLCLAKGTPPPL
jgi:hypothetical protein